SLSSCAQELLDFAEGQFNRTEVRRVLVQVAQFGSYSFNRAPNTRSFVRSEIVHDDDVATVEGRGQTVLDVGHEVLSIHRAIHHKWRNHPIIAQADHQRDGLPMSVRRVADQSDAPVDSVLAAAPSWWWRQSR